MIQIKSIIHLELLALNLDFSNLVDYVAFLYKFSSNFPLYTSPFL